VFDGGQPPAVVRCPHLLDSLVTHAPAKDRDEEAAKAKARSAIRFGAA
jgi:hypothetical protein